MKLTDIYYDLKPFIPRRLQILGRRQIAAIKRKRAHEIWPIYPEAARAPEGWTGWPDQKRFALVLSHDVDTAKGQDRSLQLKLLEEQLGFRSSFNFVPEEYHVSSALRANLTESGFEVGVHGLKHDGKLFRHRKIFEASASKINHYLKSWASVGFNSPSMHHNLEWIAELDIEYDNSTFDTDPFEPQPDGVKTIFPLWITNRKKTRGYVELPYTLPQDHTLFVILREKDINIWKEKLVWIAMNGGMAFINVHPDYMNFDGTKCSLDEYPASYYASFLEYLKNNYDGQYWHVLPRELARFWKETMVNSIILSDQREKVLLDNNRARTIWIDLDNTPHVPFFSPIKNELEKQGFRVVLTAKDAFQVCQLATRYGLDYETIGHHYGKNRIMKVFGWLWRSLELVPFVKRTKPDLALSHGSRSQTLLANLLGIPTVVIMDYEHAKTPPLSRPQWGIVPEVISANQVPAKHLLRYSGIKEDVYVPFFLPDAEILTDLGLLEDDLVVTIRPPATEAHYHNAESERIFSALMEWILSYSDAKIVLLPRNKKQGVLIKEQNEPWFSKRRIIIPQEAINGLNLLYFSDVVISGGGTMNREAAALGVPVYSIFRGPLGEVDRHLEAEGLLIMICTPEEIPIKVKLCRRNKNFLFQSKYRPALEQIVGHIKTILSQETNRQRS